MSTDNTNQTVQVLTKTSVSQETGEPSSETKQTQTPRSTQQSSDNPRALSTQRKKSIFQGGRASNRLSNNRDAPSSSIEKQRLVPKLKHIYQNSYRLEPVVKFNPERARAIIESVLQEKFSGRKYPPIVYPELVKRLTFEIREKVKEMMVERYKFVSVVVIGQKVDCSIIVASQCLSDVSVDTYASYTYENMEMYATAIVYAFYYE